MDKKTIATIINNPEDFDNNILSEINKTVFDVSEMTLSERQFINGIIRQLKPKKILEVGVAAGSTSAVILNAIKDLDGSTLYSIDINEHYYRDKTKTSGYIVPKELSSKWKLYTGGIVADFIDEIGNDIDVCILDTTHCNPGEFLDYLMVLPYLKKNAVVVIHDILLHTAEPIYATCGTLFSILNGKKIYPSKNLNNNNLEQEEYNIIREAIENNKKLKYGLPNIGAIVLASDAHEHILDIFWALTFKWTYLPEEKHYLKILDLFSKYYDKKYIDMFMRIFIENKQLFMEKANKYKLVNTLAWWIPFKSWRDKFRNKFQ